MNSNTSWIAPSFLYNSFGPIFAQLFRDITNEKSSSSSSSTVMYPARENVQLSRSYSHPYSRSNSRSNSRSPSDVCVDTKEENGIYGSYPYSWPISLGGLTKELPCQYNTAASAKKICRNMGGWYKYEETDFGACETRISEEIETISQVRDSGIRIWSI